MVQLDHPLHAEKTPVVEIHHIRVVCRTSPTFRWLATLWNAYSIYSII